MKINGTNSFRIIIFLLLTLSAILINSKHMKRSQKTDDINGLSDTIDEGYSYQHSEATTLVQHYENGKLIKNDFEGNVHQQTNKGKSKDTYDEEFNKDINSLSTTLTTIDNNKINHSELKGEEEKKHFENNALFSMHSKAEGQYLIEKEHHQKKGSSGKRRRY